MNVTEKFIAFNEPDLGEEEMSAVMDVIRSGWIGTGKVSHQFEEEFADFYKAKYAIGVSSCTMGLMLSLKAMGIKSHDNVITTPLTFAATLNAIIHAGGEPILADVDETGCIDTIKANIISNSFTKAFLPVHYSGTPCNIGEFKMGIPVIEDCAHAFGAKFKWRGACQVFSFYANKNITSGEGGMVLTNDEGLADEIRILSSQGLSKGAWRRHGEGPIQTYDVEKVGYKGNLPDILACIGLVQLRRWPELKEKRNIVFKVYEDAFGEMPEGHSHHFYPLLIENRDAVRSLLHGHGILAGTHYRPLHLEPAYKYFGYREGDFPKAEKWGEQILSLPVSAKMDKSDAERIVSIIKGE